MEEKKNAPIGAAEAGSAEPCMNDQLWKENYSYTGDFTLNENEISIFKFFLFSLSYTLFLQSSGYCVVWSSRVLLSETVTDKRFVCIATAPSILTYPNFLEKILSRQGCRLWRVYQLMCVQCSTACRFLETTLTPATKN